MLHKFFRSQRFSNFNSVLWVAVGQHRRHFPAFDLNRVKVRGRKMSIRDFGLLGEADLNPGGRNPIQAGVEEVEKKIKNKNLCGWAGG